MLVLGQVPSGRSRDALDVLAMLRSRYAPDDGGQDAGGAGGGDSKQGDDDQPTGKDGKPFDADRAQRTIDRQTEELRILRAQAKELADARTRLKEIEDKDKSEVERLAGSAKEASEKLAAAEARAQDLAIRLSVAESAEAAGIPAKNLKAAIRILDRKAVELDADGEPTNVEAVLKALVKDFPILTMTEGGSDEAKPPTQAVPSTPKPAGKPGPKDAENEIYKRIQETQGVTRW